MLYQCPKCKNVLIKNEKCYICKNNHTYDIAKNGYVNLSLLNKKITGDNQAMVQARTKFLSSGYYAPLKHKLCTVVKALQPEVILDMGCGQGYYTNALKHEDKKAIVYGFDLSKYALKVAAKEKGVYYAVASVADVPMPDKCADVIVSVFAPIYSKENHRLLKSKGFFIKVEPKEQHLYELKQILYKDVYENQLDTVIYEGFDLITTYDIEENIQVIGKDHIQALFQMTPYYYRSPKDTALILQDMKQVSTKIQFRILFIKSNKVMSIIRIYLKND